MNGIMFRPWKTKAIAEYPDREWQTRRLDGLKEINLEPDVWQFDDCVEGQYYSFSKALKEYSTASIIIKPRYHVGEVVYIKEAHYAYGHWTQFYESGKSHWEFFRHLDAIVYFTDTEWQHALTKPSTKEGWYKRSPLFLPAECARYFIKILDVTPQRLQEITFEDCLAEGVVHTEHWQTVDYKPPEPLRPDDLSNEEADKETERGWIAYTIQAYASLWDSINPKYPWSSNPLDWRYEFKWVDK